jgi:hypothetical protein
MKKRYLTLVPKGHNQNPLNKSVTLYHGTTLRAARNIFGTSHNRSRVFRTHFFNHPEKGTFTSNRNHALKVATVRAVGTGSHPIVFKVKLTNRQKNEYTHAVKWQPSVIGLRKPMPSKYLHHR